MNRQYLRSERAYLFNPSSNLFMLYRLSNSFSKEELEKAAYKLVKAFPLLNRTIEFDEKHEAYLQSIDMLLPLIQYEHKKNYKYYKKVLSEEERIPFNLRNGSLLRIIVISDDKSTDLLFMMHHLLGDCRTLYEISSSYLKILDHSYALQDYCDDLLDSVKIKQSYFEKQFIRRVNNSWYKHPFVLKEDDYRKLYNHFYTRFRTKIKKKVFTKEQTAKIMAFCHENHLTVNTLIFTAFLWAEKKYQINDTNSFIINKESIDLRKFIDDKRLLLGNYSSNISFDYRYNNNHSFIDNMKRLQAIIHKKIEIDTLWSSIVFYESIPQGLFDAMYYNGDVKDCPRVVTKLKRHSYDIMHRNGLSVANLGKKELPLNNLKLNEVFLLPANMANTEKTIGAITVNNGLVITMEFNAMNTNQKDMGCVFDGAIQKILECIK